MSGREVGVGIAASQVISNVPAALLLSGFTRDYAKLLVGVNIGGLGTLIASMASLISYKQYALTFMHITIMNRKENISGGLRLPMWDIWQFCWSFMD